MPDLSRGSLGRLQDRLCALLGCDPTQRVHIVTTMLGGGAIEATSYWLQFLVAVGIATLGLALDSSAVIIGAMLIAPLMGPIVRLGMGLATGSPFLVLRSAGRVAVSVITAVGCSAALTWLLPFHELNAEILARITPTALDLLTAAFCALAGAYATLRPGSDTASTAAGTSIGISLVPPLCASGYGLGTSNWHVAGGAALLFVTNVVAIIAVATVAFVAVGFNRVGVSALERDELQDETGAPIASALARRLASVFESRVGPLARWSMPLVLLALVYVPLRHALNEVVWEVRVRTAAQKALAGLKRRVLQSHVRVDRHEIDAVIVIVGSVADSLSARAVLDRELRAASGVVPRLEVLAVPDATEFAGLESTLRTAQAQAQVPTKPDPRVQLDDARAHAASSVRALWPANAAGDPLAIDIVTTGEPLGVRVVHLGAPLDASAQETFAKALGRDVGRDVALTDVALPTDEITPEGGDLAFVEAVAVALTNARGVPGLFICITEPKRVGSAREKALGVELRTIFATTPDASMAVGEAWSVRLALEACTGGAATTTPKPATSAR